MNKINCGRFQVMFVNEFSGQNDVNSVFSGAVREDTLKSISIKSFFGMKQDASDKRTVMRGWKR